MLKKFRDIPYTLYTVHRIPRISLIASRSRAKKLVFVMKMLVFSVS